MEKCSVCFQDKQERITIKTYLEREDVLCGVCRRSLKEIKKKFYLDKLEVESLYEYSDEIEDLLYRFKESRDVALSPLFLHPYKRYIKKKYKNYTCIYVPSSYEKNKERGFFALELLFEEVNLNKLALFLKNKNMKQSLQNYEDRKNISAIIALDKSVKIPSNKLLLIDDMCTSGSTLQSMYHLLEGHSLQVKALVICVNKKLLD